MRTYSKKVYCRQCAISRTTTSCLSRTQRRAHHSPHFRLPAFQCAWVHWTRKLAAEQSRSKSRGLFSVDSVVCKQMVYRRKISDTDQLKQALIDSWIQRSQDTLNRAIDQLPKRIWQWLSRQSVVMFNFVWTNRVLLFRFNSVLLHNSFELDDRSGY